MKTFYRPKWTCGRYNEQNHAAIYYNNITGYSYFFEESSADVIGAILGKGRNNPFTIEELSQSLMITEDSIAQFVEMLMNEGLITPEAVTEEGIASYRQAVVSFRQSQPHNIDKAVKDKLPMSMSSAEQSYTEKAGMVASVMFELTYRCSEMCIHCYNIGATRNDEEESHRADTQELTLDEYKRVIDELYDLGLFKVCFSGGDPFSNANAWGLIDYVYNKEIAFDVFTNGQLLTDYKRLADYFPRAVGISIYSGVARDHDYITRVKGSWEKSVRAMRELAALSVPLELKCCVMRPNLKTYHTIYELCHQFGAQPQMEINISDSIEGDQCARSLRLRPEELEVVLRDENMALYVGKEAPNYGGMERHLTNNACGAGDNTFCITPNGDIIPCCAFHLHYGNVREQSIAEILATSENKAYWNRLTLKDYEECGKYDYCNYCNLCAGHNMSEHGTPTRAGENCCYTAKIRHGLAMRMMNESYDPLNGKTLALRLSEFPVYIPEKLQRIFKNRDNS